MNDLNQILADLSPEKRELLAMLLEEEGVDTSQLPIPRRSEEINLIPLSFPQEQLWAFDQFQPGNTAYNLPANIHLTGPLNVAALENSLNEIIRRHEALRTTLTSIDGQPVQVIAPTQTLNLPVTNLQDLPKTQQEAEVQRLALEEVQQPFNLAKGPLLRVTLLRLDVEEHVLLITMHHTISDGWSMGVFNRELSALYEAFSLGQPSPLSQPPIQYADFAAWQRGGWADDALAEQLAYWKKQLQDISPILELPTDRPRPAVQTYRGAHYSMVFPEPLSEALKALSQGEGVTLFMTLLTAFKMLLCRYTRQTDIVVGTPVANRNRTEIEELIGFFVNTIVLRSDLSGDLSFRELLARVNQGTLDAFAHEDMPLGKLVEELQPDRDLSYNPLFQVMFALQNAPNQPPELKGLTVTNLGIDPETAQFDLTLDMFENDNGLRGTFEYNTDLFDMSTIERMAKNFQTLLAGIVANPDEQISKLPLLTEEEHYQLLIEWNDTHLDYPRQSCVHNLFEKQVEQTPDAIAVIFRDQQVSYQELNHRANQLAHYLQSLGTKPDTLVGICMENSIDTMVGLLGTLKAGGAYLPLDPTYPQERIAFMLEDSQATVLLTLEHLVESLPKHSAKIVCLDTDWKNISRQSQENPVSGSKPHNLAYVIYTSGSTGRPKGVQIPHQALVNHNFGIINNYRLRPDDRVLQFASMSFDVAAEEVYPSWLSGATVVLRSERILTSFADFSQFIETEKLTVLNLPAPFWHEWISELSRSEAQLPPTLRLVIVGSEKVLPERFATWRELVGDRVGIRNAYGPTEATITATIYEPAGSQKGQKSYTVPIGRPIANMKIYILDEHMQPVPIGVPGELYIGGDGLARGYLNRSELTTEKFITHPFSNEPNIRLYKTGDLVRYLPDGNVEFLGRVDHQVKVRGFRIELGEIEAVLGEHPAVQENVVIVREDTPGSKRVTAYLVLETGSTSTVNELRSFMKAKLPDYMIPALFMILETFPLMPNGKINRKALPTPDQLRPELEESYVAPTTASEKVLAEIWAEILKVERVGIYDNFFELGGHSLLAVYLFHQIETTFGQKLPLATLFQAPTIAQLAALLDKKSEVSWSSLVPIQPNGSRPFFFFVHAHGGNVVGYYDLARHLGQDQPVYGLQAQGLNGEDVGTRRFEDMAAHYIEEIRTVQPYGPYFLGGWCLGGDVALEMAQQLQEQGEEVALVAMVENPLPDYPKSLPGTTVFHRLIYRLIDRVHLEISNFLEVEAEAKLAFSLERTRRLLTGVQVNIEKMIEPVLAKFDLPHSQAYTLTVLAEAHEKAYEDYEPRPYRGKVTLFRASKQPLGIQPDPTLGWGKLIEDGLDIHEIPGHRIGMLNEPRVQIVAEQLQACMDKIHRQTANHEGTG